MKRPKDAKPRRPEKKSGKAPPSSLPAPERLQYAALPWRKSDGLEIMLVSSRETGRWIIPKGWSMAGRRGAAAAAIEAIEEAGLLGAISDRPIGHYTYVKRFARGEELCRVEVYSLRVVRQRNHWPEKEQRDTKWFPAKETIGLVSDPELADLIAEFIRSSKN